MKCIFILYSFNIVDVHIFLYKFGQTLCSLTLTKSYMRTKKKRREYVVIPLVVSCERRLHDASPYLGLR